MAEARRAVEEGRFEAFRRERLASWREGEPAERTVAPA
jgi:queuine/archaeosine tRNA-ribosyltransferase